MDKLHLETEIAKMGYDTTNTDVSKYITETIADAKPWQSNATIVANMIDILQYNGVETATENKLNCLLDCAKWLISTEYVFTATDLETINQLMPIKKSSRKSTRYSIKFLNHTFKSWAQLVCGVSFDGKLLSQHLDALATKTSSNSTLDERNKLLNTHLNVNCAKYVHLNILAKNEAMAWDLQPHNGGQMMKTTNGDCITIDECLTDGCLVVNATKNKSKYKLHIG